MKITAVLLGLLLVLANCTACSDCAYTSSVLEHYGASPDDAAPASEVLSEAKYKTRADFTGYCTEETFYLVDYEVDCGWLVVREAYLLLYSEAFKCIGYRVKDLGRTQSFSAIVPLDHYLMYTPDPSDIIDPNTRR
jgi:hypothetical protein